MINSSNHHHQHHLQHHNMTTSIDELTSELYMSSKVVVSIYSVLFVISAIGNTTVFISLVKNRNRKLRINLLILNLTIGLPV